MGIQPDVILCRADHEVTAEIRRQDLALLRRRGARRHPAARPMDSIYQVPLVLQDEGLGDFVIERLGLDAAPRDLATWRELVERLEHPHGEVNDRRRRQVRRAARRLPLGQGIADPRRHRAAVRVDIHWVHSERLEQEPRRRAARRRRRHPVCPAASASAASRARSKRRATPARTASRTSGSASGMQVMVIEFARNVLGLDRRQLHRVRPPDAASR